MAFQLNSKSAIAAGGISAVAIGALAMSVVMGPASADDATATPTTGAAAGANGLAGEDRGRGPGGHGPMGMIAEQIDGTILAATDTFQADDGTITVVRRQEGEVTAISSTSVTVKTSSLTNSYAINADTEIGRFGDEVLADIAVGDTVEVKAIVAGDTATAIELHTRMAPPIDDDADGTVDGDRDGDGAMGMGHGRGQGMGMGHGPEGMSPEKGGPLATFGDRILTELTVEKTDGTIVTVRETRGEVVSVSGSTITYTDEAGNSKTVTVPAGVTPQRNGADAAVSDFIAGDNIHVLAEVNGSTETVITVHGGDMMAGPQGHMHDGLDDDVDTDDTNA